MRGKRELVARVSALVGLTSLLEALPQRGILMVLNYHRIGDASKTRYDSNVYSATVEGLWRQIQHFKKRFHVATLEEALELMTRPASAPTCILLTFDDGYRDNYTSAYPVLRSEGLQGTFFLPTSLVGTAWLTWWDEIAYIIKQSRNPRIRLTYPKAAEFDLDAYGPVHVGREVLRLFKAPAVMDKERFIRELEEACGAARPTADAERMFLNWDEAREMQAHGMAFGSHSHSYEILSKLPAESQRNEARVSREILERELGRKIDTMAYPVGQRDSFSSETVEALRECGYRAAFSYYGGLNRPGKMQPFNILRHGVGDQSHARLRLQTAIGAVTGSRWF